MILLADSGSTKTSWRLIDDQKNIHQSNTQGINPYFQSVQDISGIIKEELLTSLPPDIAAAPMEIFFYGAGCTAADKQSLITGALKMHFPKGEISVESDMLGAARSLCGHHPGIAAILGTGMNTCYYDGSRIAQTRFSSGFILGDEGSGAHIGKIFISAWLNDDVPEEISKRFRERYKLEKDEIIDTVYRKPLPNRFLASFSKFVYQNLKEQYMVDLVSKCLEEFFDKHVCRYPQHKQVKLSCTGSVAFYYSNILRAVALNKGVNIDTITETPIAGLTLFHLGE